MSTAQTARFHQDMLGLSVTDIPNNAINPTPKATAYLRNMWLKDSHGTLGGVSMVSAPSNEDIVDDEEKFTRTQHFEYEINGPLDRCTPALSENEMNALKLLHDEAIHFVGKFRDGNTLGAINAFRKRLANNRTSSQLNCFLYSAGSSSVAVPGTGRGKIPCQPTSVSRRRIGMLRGAAPTGKGRKRTGSLIGKVTNEKGTWHSVYLRTNHMPRAMTLAIK